MQSASGTMRGRWTTGLIVGPLIGIAFLVLPTYLGVVLGVFGAFALLRARGLSAVAGMLCATGISGLALLAQSEASCATAYAGCWAPNFRALAIAAAAVLITGVSLTLVLYARARTAARSSQSSKPSAT